MIFSTHYHQLQSVQDVTVCRMGYRLTESSLVYLYKLEQKACYSSFGFNVARIAGIPAIVIKSAQLKSEWLK